MTKLIEMTLDGRLSLIWVAVIFILGWGVYELCRKFGKSGRYYK